MTASQLDLRRPMSRPGARLLPLPIWQRVRSAAVRRRYADFRAGDVILDAFPKSGSTWLRFVLVDLFLQSNEVGFRNVDDYSPLVGRHRGAPAIIDSAGRLIKSHEPLHAGESSPARVIYVVRDGRDVAVSFYHFLKRTGVYDGPFDLYIDAFLAGRIGQYGSWQDHVAGWFEAAAAEPKRITVIRYEDLLQSPTSTLVGALKDIGLAFSDEAVERALEQNDFEAMRAKESAAPPLDTGAGSPKGAAAVNFVRSGRSGQWGDVFESETLDLFSRHAGTALLAAGYQGH